MAEKPKSIHNQTLPILSIIIPVYNEINTVMTVIEKVKRAPLPGHIHKEIIVVDDASTDGSRERLCEINDPSIKVILHTHNQGKGGAIRTALTHAGGDLILIQDADLEYDPDEYPKLIVPLISDSSTDIVYGSRFLGHIENMKLPNYIANRFLTFLTNVLYGSKITDLCTGYKVYRSNFIKNIKLERDHFDFEHELTAKLLLRKANIYEVPVRYCGRDVNSGKKVGWADFFSNLYTLFRYRYW